MKKLFILGLAALLTLAVGCGKKDTDTDGTPPIEGISQTGNTTDDRKIVYIPLWMEDYSVVYYDGELNRTIAQGGELTEEEIAEYVALGESRGRAGAYGIEGIGVVLVQSIQGDYPNIVGLPVAETIRRLHKLLGG